jgi:alkylation response protein AidB-like acyl-CoA dehydrogenase
MIFTEEQRLFRRSVREFAQTELAPAVAEILSTGKVPPKLYKRAGELGYLGVNCPEEFGGAGLGQVEACILFEELARVCPGYALSLEIIIVSNNIIRQSGALTAKYLSRLLAGDSTLGSGATPPEGQPNVAEHVTFLKRTEGGYVANGTRHYGTNSDADVVYCLGLDEDGNTKAAFFERGWSGFEQHPPAKKLGMAGNSGGTMVFEDVFVPDENITEMAIGTSETYYQVYNGCAAEALGCAKGLFERTVEFAKTRTHDFKPLTEMSAVAYKLAELQSKIKMCESMVYDCACFEDEWDRTLDEQIQAEWFLVAESNKVRVSEMLVDVTVECLKLHGGLGYHDPMVWHYVGDSLNYCIMDITNEIHYGYIASLMGL